MSSTDTDRLTQNANRTKGEHRSPSLLTPPALHPEALARGNCAEDFAIASCAGKLPQAGWPIAGLWWSPLSWLAGLDLVTS